MADTTEVEATGAIALVFKAAVAHFAQPVQKHCPDQCILGLSFVQPDLHAPAQRDVLHPIECE
jgi:hypothetical protein